GDFVRLSVDKNSRIHCEQRPVTITEETVNTLSVSIAPGPACKLLRTDTFYPGWRAELNGQTIPLERATTPFSTVNIPPSESVSTVKYTYRPSHFRATIWLSVTAGLVLVGIAVGTHVRLPEQ